MNTGNNEIDRILVIDDVLDMSKIEAGQLEIVREPFDLGAAIEEAVMTVQPLADRKHLSLAVEIAPDMGLIASDRRRVKQILLNLLDNAIKFTEKGRIVVECRLHDEFFSIRVTDTGIGIKAEDMDKLFQPFRQIDDSRTRRYEGTGLGLSICKRLANLLGGTIQAESIWVKGSSFTFTAPTGNGMVTQGKTKAEMGNRPIAVPVASVLP